MKKQRNLIYGLLGGISVLEILFIILFAAHVINLIWFIVLTLVVAIAAAGLAYLLVIVLKKMKQAELDKKKKEELMSSGNYIQDIYKILGIPPQYNKDGTLKSIYDLLEIKPAYDENGNRILTVYENLQMMPKFGQNGKEIPLVFAIKNRVGKIARVNISTKFLTRKLTPEEQEARIIRETLEKKLKEAEEAKDLAKAMAIKKAIIDQKQQKKKAKEKKDSKGPGKSSAAKPGKVTQVTLANVKFKNVNIFDIFNKKQEPKKEPKKEPAVKKTPEPENKKPEAPAKTGTQNQNNNSTYSAFIIATNIDREASR